MTRNSRSSSKYGEGLNTTLILVSPVSQCLAVYALTRPQVALSSALTSAFIINVRFQFLPNKGEEPVAILQVLIYKIDKGQCCISS